MPLDLLNDSTIKAARPRKGKRSATQHKLVPYVLRDGGGLQVVVQPDGKKYWQFRYTFAGKPKLMGLGVYPDVTLAQAREAAVKLRAARTENKDALTVRRLDRHNVVRETEATFGAVAKKWLEKNKRIWMPGNYNRHASLLRRILLPSLEHLPIAHIDEAILSDAFEPHEERGVLETVRQARTTAGMVFRFAISKRLRKGNPAREVELTPPDKVEHYKAIGIGEVASLWSKLNDATSGMRAQTRAGLKLVLLIALRTYTLRHARWRDIDFAGAQWFCPAENMKGRKKLREDFVTPLSVLALDVLRELQPLTDRGPDSYIFLGFGSKNPVMSATTMNDALHALGFNGTPHGMRTLMTSHLAEQGFPKEVRDLQIAHVIGSKTDRAYMRSQLWRQRVVMMDFWADTVRALIDGKPVPEVVDNVIQIRRAA